MGSNYIGVFWWRANALVAVRSLLYITYKVAYYYRSCCFASNLRSSTKTSKIVSYDHDRLLNNSSSACYTNRIREVTSFSMTIASMQTKKDTFGNSVDRNETTRDESSYQDLPVCLFLFLTVTLICNNERFQVQRWKSPLQKLLWFWNSNCSCFVCKI